MMSAFRCLPLATALVLAPAAWAASDAEVSRWLGELVGSEIVLQELAAGHCSRSSRPDAVDIERWYSWAASLGSPAGRAMAEGRKAQFIADARAAASEWVAGEFGDLSSARPLGQSCSMYMGVFRTIRNAAEAQLEDIEYGLRERVTPRAQR